MIKNFLIVDCTGKNNFIALNYNNKFFIKKLQINLHKNEILALEIVDFVKKHCFIHPPEFCWSAKSEQALQ